MVLRLYVLPIFALLAAAQENAPAPPPKPEPQPDQRVELNLLGKVNTQSGESRRNENVQFNLIDNNTRKELNSRLGTSATIVEEFHPDRNYFGTEYGNAPPASLMVAPSKVSALHGALFETYSD